VVRSFLTRAGLGLLSLAALSCASIQLSDEEQAEWGRAMDTPLTFIVSREQSLETWDRAQEFIGRYSSTKLRSTTDSLLVSYDSPTYQNVPPAESGSAIHYGYSISRSRDPEGVRIGVQCISTSKLGEKSADQNAHIAAYYIRTGTLGCNRCIVR